MTISKERFEQIAIDVEYLIEAHFRSNVPYCWNWEEQKAIAKSYALIKELEKEAEVVGYMHMSYKDCISNTNAKKLIALPLVSPEGE